ncbi:hypothetical protein F8M41_000640 [Gigaspora margarita]|uniref:Uncharacterized protein n=1 Tax=Gigaspora margarita TaxID=4874 RepID=A0A8H3XFN4_GIGMA|nr:hypothetical protein F8M41_000640 [Gigaspora margarita]
MQVPFTDIPLVLDLCIFDIISSGGGTLSEGYEILSQDHTNKGQNGYHKGKCNWKGRIVVPQNKPLNLCNIEYHGNHNLEHVWTKPLRMASSVRKTITNRTTSVTPSILAAGYKENFYLKNQAQLTSTRFVPNLEAIQNALKYDKKLYYPSVLEYEKVSSIMDTHESEGTIISKQYGIKDTQDPKEQAVLLGIASTIMPTLLTKF